MIGDAAAPDVKAAAAAMEVKTWQFGAIVVLAEKIL